MNGMRAGRGTLGARALCVVVCTALGCTSPTATDAPVELLVGQEYSFACRAWTPSPPPVARTLFDLRLSQIDTASNPASNLVNAVAAAGGRIVYRFHGPMVRVELDVGRVPQIAGINSAVTVAEPGAHTVVLIVLLAHDLTSDDLEAVQALGGRVTNRFDALEGYTVAIDDAQVPAVRALPGVNLVGFNGSVCAD
jgi:hypothetical protein